MPKREIAARGGAVKYRTIQVGKGRYIRVAIVPKRGKRGGHTISGNPHKLKSAER